MVWRSTLISTICQLLEPLSLLRKLLNALLINQKDRLYCAVFILELGIYVNGRRVAHFVIAFAFHHHRASNLYVKFH